MAHDDLDDLLRQVRTMACRMPLLTVLAEFAAFGPLLYVLVGGRSGVQRFREGVQLDDAEFIPLYRRTYEAALADAPAQASLLRQVERAVAHDRRENAHLLAAFDLLDPAEHDQRPRLLAATGHTAPATGHAAAKFALLLPPTLMGIAARGARRR